MIIFSNRKYIFNQGPHFPAMLVHQSVLFFGGGLINKKLTLRETKSEFDPENRLKPNRFLRMGDSTKINGIVGFRVIHDRQFKSFCGF